MVQQGQTFELTRRGPDGGRLWAYRYRSGGRGSRRVQRGGFASEQDARDALERELERLRRERRIARQADARRTRREVLRPARRAAGDDREAPLAARKAVAVFGDRRDQRAASQEIAAWRMTFSPGYRFEATQALRQVLHRAVAWGMLDVNPAKVGVDNPVRRRTEKQHPFESWEELEAVATALGPRYGPMVMFAAATGLRPARMGRARAARHRPRGAGRLRAPRLHASGGSRCTKTEASVRAVPLQAIALDALEQIPRQRLAAALPGRARRLPRPAQLPHRSGNPPRRPPGSSRCGASTISATPSPPSRSVPASPPSTSLATWAPA